MMYLFAATPIHWAHSFLRLEILMTFTIMKIKVSTPGQSMELQSSIVGTC